MSATDLRTQTRVQSRQLFRVKRELNRVFALFCYITYIFLHYLSVFILQVLTSLGFNSSPCHISQSWLRQLMTLNISSITNKESLQEAVNQLAAIFESTQTKYSKLNYITKYSKEQQSQNCTNNLSRYHVLGDLPSWKNFKALIQDTKQKFFNNMIVMTQ